MADGPADDSRQQSDPATGAAQLEPSTYDMAVDDSLQQLDDDALTYFSSTVTNLIAKRIDGIHYAESRRSQIAVIGGALAAAGLALFTLRQATESPSLKATYTVAAATAILVGVIVWLQFALQTNFRYPFLSQKPQTWKWFYWGALPDAKKFGPSFWRIRRRRARREGEQKELQQQWELFRGQVTGLSDRRVDATQDLRQLYLLHVDERYKNLFLTRLRNTLAIGVLSILSLSLLTFLVSQSIQGGSGSRDHTSHESPQTGVNINAWWTPTGAVRNGGISSRDIEYRVVLTVENNGSAPFCRSALVGEDASGRPIPIEFQVAPHRIDLPPGRSVTLLGHFWISGSDGTELRRVDLR